MVIRPSIQGASARYEPLIKLASGGMATVYVGRLSGALGFQRLVAIKRPHRHLLDDPRFVRMLLAEATLASKLQHPNVVSVQDVVQVDGVVYLVMDLVEGASLSELEKAARERGEPIPPALAIRVFLDVCAGLHAAHELKDDAGEPMGLVHRDVSPHNVLVGTDGVARVADFGIAKCVNLKDASTTTGTLKGKYAYMAPEHIEGKKVDRRADVFSLGVVAWELFAGRRLFLGESPPATMMKVMREPAPLLSQVTDLFGTALDDVLEQALAKDPSHRFLTAEAFGAALEACARPTCGVAPATRVGKLVESLVGEGLAKRKKQLRTLLDERDDSAGDPERPTEPLPEHMAALDQAPSLVGGPPSQTQSLHLETVAEAHVGIAAEPSRPPLLPDSERTSGPQGPTPVTAVTEAVPRTSRKSVAWLAVVAALIAGVGATLAIQHFVGGSEDNDSETAATSAVSAPEVSAVATESVPPTTPVVSVEPAASADAEPPPQPTVPAEPRKVGKAPGAATQRTGPTGPADAAAVPPATASSEEPPPNPYAQ